MYQKWFITAGTGVNGRLLPNLPLTVTKRIAHVALAQTPGELSVEEGWRWAQVVGVGGSERLAQAVIATRLGKTFADEEFWETVVRFFVDNPLLDPSQVGPLVDYLVYERETPRVIGDRDRLPAEFTMKGRTPTALLTRMEVWHKRLANEKRVTHESWRPSGLGEFIREEREQGGAVRTWSIVELTTAKALIHEGNTMCHCVATYAGACARGDTSVWSVRIKRPFDIDPVHVMTIAVSRGKAVTEARGKRNALPGGVGGSWGARLCKNDADLLVESVTVVRRWATREGIILPLYMRMAE